jgi:MOSC domain-containing protein YiiM
MHMRGVVVSVSRDARHHFSKPTQLCIELVAGLGVAGDAHMGATVKHRSRAAKDPTLPNLRQVHLIHAELLDDLRGSGFDVVPGALGENITTAGIDLLALPRRARLTLGDTAVVEITGLRNPCRQIDDFRAGLMRAVPKPGVMAIVVAGGTVQAGDPIFLSLGPEPHEPLKHV